MNGLLRDPGEQLVYLAILAIPVACVSWTITHEEVFREPREWCVRESKIALTFAARRFFYLLTCEYCFSHYVAVAFVALSRFQMMLPDWRGYLLAWFSLVWVANIYMSVFGRLRLDIKHEHVEIPAKEIATEFTKKQTPGHDGAAARKNT